MSPGRSGLSAIVRSAAPGALACLCRAMTRGLPLSAALAVGSTLAASPAPARAARRTHHRHAAGRAPTGPPLSGGFAAPGEGEQTAGIPSPAGDQLVENGLSSPLCKGPLAGRLSSAAQADCRTSGFVGAPAPTNDYALDVHIDTGAFGLSRGALLSVVQDIFIAPAWGALEWLVHGLLAMLEWCYTLELLGGSSTGAVASALAHARASFTDPWLALVLALASVLALYHGLVRRRVADTLGGALTMFAMTAGGLWVIADPAGTVGAVGQWAGQASLGTLGATAGGSPASGAATLGDSMRALYAGAIETPWCYLEFGNVRWCSDPSQLDPRLRAAALALVARGGTQGTVSAHGAELVRAATTNGGLFLAFPANGPARNSINDEGSLLRAICRSEDATKCAGPAASEAEFRTDGGTFPRVLGLLAIAVGVLGMAMLFGLIALRLLAAAFLSLFLLLLAPFAVLAPALGDGGRAVFAGWLTRLLGAVTSKLLFSFVLGALFTMQRLLVALAALGWWTQWLLISAFWWTVFLKRHQAAVVLHGAARSTGQGRGRSVGGSHGAGGGARVSPGGADGRRSGGQGRWPLARRVERSLQAYGAIRHPGRWAEAQINARTAQRPPREEKLGRSKQRAAALGVRPQDRRPDAGRGRESATAPAIAPASGSRRMATVVRRARDAAHAALGGDRGRQASSGKGIERAGKRASAPAGSARVSRGATEGSSERTPPAPARPRDGAGGVSRKPELHPPSANIEEAAARRQVAGARRSRSPSSPTRPLDDVRSPIMEDALAVAQRRKRQLGFDSKP